MNFNTFFRTLWGYDPFPWQEDLATYVATQGHWPQALDIPTGLGKTVVLDIAVWALTQNPRLPVRNVFVVDRRTVVDQAHDRACSIREKVLRDPRLLEIKEALANISGDTENPLEVSVLRGGVAKDESWCRHPRKATLMLSTVDQIGSRLLFRGYGVSDKAKPIHAGLLAFDTHYLLDEVHLSIPFRKMLSGIRDRVADTPLGLLPYTSTELSATLPSASAQTWTLGAGDYQNPVIQKRVFTSKVVTPAPVAKSFEADASVYAVMALAKGHKVVAVIANRVYSAREIFDTLSSPAMVKKHGAKVALLTGRMRSCDRREVEAKILPHVLSGRDRSQDTPYILVATQCIEAGADFDFDYMVTECASSDALIQRFGRVNRLGEYAGTGDAGVVLFREGSEIDVIYGPAYLNTYDFLLKNKSVDFASGNRPVFPWDTKSPSPEILPLRDQDFDILPMTSPVPTRGTKIPDVLHGVNLGIPDVQVAWRELDPALSDTEVEKIKLLPLASSELISLPFLAVKYWLENGKQEDFGDAGVSAAKKVDKKKSLPFIAYDGQDSVVSTKLTPGITIIVPTTYGGIRPDDWQWDPKSKTPVPDVSEVEIWNTKSRFYLRVLPTETTPVPAFESARECRDWVLSEGYPSHQPVPRGCTLHPYGNGFLLEGSRRGIFTADSSKSYDVGYEVTLKEHLEDVAGAAVEYATLCGLDVDMFRLAGELHDIGKADKRFQIILRNGDEFAAECSVQGVEDFPLLAKSNPRVKLSREQSAAVYALAGYIPGTRHEIMSVAMLEGAGVDDDTLHLIASHHGYARPFAPAIPDTCEENVTYGPYTAKAGHGLDAPDSGIADRFRGFVQKYGIWGSAYMEAVFRLADHEGSRRGAKRGAV